VSPAHGATGEHSVPVFEHVVVGVDRREGGRDAIALAARLASEGARLTLAHVYRGDDSAWRGAVPPYAPAERRQAEQELQTAAREAAVVAAVRCHGAASVGRGLHELAELAAADVLVVGSSRRGVVGRVLLGDDTRASLNGAPRAIAIAIAPAGFAHPPEADRVGVAYNESPESKHALSVGRTLAAEHNAKLLTLEAISIPGYALGTGLIPMPVDDCTQSLLEGARDRLSGLDGVETQAVPARRRRRWSPSAHRSTC